MSPPALLSLVDRASCALSLLPPQPPRPPLPSSHPRTYLHILHHLAPHTLARCARLAAPSAGLADQFGHKILLPLYYPDTLPLPFSPRFRYGARAAPSCPPIRHHSHQSSYCRSPHCAEIFRFHSISSHRASCAPSWPTWPVWASAARASRSWCWPGRWCWGRGSRP